MLTETEFAVWFEDYKGRFPAVGDYVDRQELPSKLLDSWRQSLAAFDSDILGAVTAGIVDGTWEPVANVDLGQFGHHIRRLCRLVLDRRREAHQRQEWRQQTYTPLLSGSMLDGVFAGQAVDLLLAERTGRQPDIRDAAAFQKEGSVHWDHPTCGAFCAAIILADDHTAYEEEQCLATLRQHGLTWDEVQAKAKALKLQRQTLPPTHEVTHGEIRPGAAVPSDPGPTEPAPRLATGVARAGASVPPEQEVAF